MGNFKEAMKRIRTVAESLPDDDPDKQEMLDIEGDYSKLMEWAIIKRSEALIMADGCKSLSDTYTERKKRFENKSERIKDVIRVIMDCANERSYKGVAGTVSISQVKPKPIIQDENKVPDRFKKTTVSIDKAAINKAVKEGEDISGVVMDNGGEAISIRIK